MPIIRPATIMSVGFESSIQSDVRGEVQRPYGSLHRLFQAVSASVTAAVFVPLSMLTTRRAERFLFALLLLDIPLNIDKHFSYQEAAASHGAVGGWGISLTTAALAGLYIGWILRSLADPAAPRDRLRFHRALTWYVGITCVSALAAQDVTLSAFEIFLLLQMFLVFLYVANRVNSRDDLLFVLKWLLIGLVIESMMILAIHRIGHEFGITGVETRIYGAADTVRVGGTVGSANNAGAYLAVCLSLAVAVLLSHTERRYFGLALVAIATGLLALILTSSRGAWSGFVVALGVSCFAKWRVQRLQLRSVFILAVVVGLVVLASWRPIEGRISRDDRGAAYARVPLMKLAFRMISDNPVLGVGANNFGSVIDRYATGELRSAFVSAVHDKYLLIWAETGTFGLLAFLLFLFTTLRQGWRCTRLDDRLLSALAIGLVAGISALMVHMLVDIFRGRSLTQLLWVMAALITAIPHISAQKSISTDAGSRGRDA